MEAPFPISVHVYEYICIRVRTQMRKEKTKCTFKEKKSRERIDNGSKSTCSLAAKQRGGETDCRRRRSFEADFKIKKLTIENASLFLWRFAFENQSFGC